MLIDGFALDGGDDLVRVAREHAALLMGVARDYYKGGLPGHLEWSGRRCLAPGHRRPPAPGMWQDIGDHDEGGLRWSSGRS